MSKVAHHIYVSILVSIVVLTTVFLLVRGVPYYSTGLEERFYHPDHDYLKPSGIFGHGAGVIGTLLILIGVFAYIARKRYGFLSRFGRLKYWLEFHIFLCILGPILILFHTAFKFGGIVSVSFWSMVAVVISGVIGRFIYIQIPRTIEGRELSLNEITAQKNSMKEDLKRFYTVDTAIFAAVMDFVQGKPRINKGNLATTITRRFLEDRRTIKEVREILKKNRISPSERRKILRVVRQELSLNNRIDKLQSMQKLFKNWHVAHLPFAIIMLVFLVIHVGIVLTFGYKWIF